MWRPCRTALGQVILALAEETRSTAFFFLKSDFALLEQRFLQNLQRCNEGGAKAKLARCGEAGAGVKPPLEEGQRSSDGSGTGRRPG
ncbi:hypothetical protein QQF64_021938, partial [Cirrhinus molitorella]